MAEAGMPARPWLVGTALLLAGVLGWGRLIVETVSAGGAMSGDVAALQRTILWYALLPRGVMALAAGAALGLAGLILQRVLHNPLAEPSTLGISGGAQLALVAATLYAPGLMERSRSGVALGGALAVAVLLLSFAWRRRLEPVTVSLAGMILGLTTSAAGATLILAHGEYLFSMFLWGGGSLVQQGWVAPLAVLWRLFLGWSAAALLTRPLVILGLGDEPAGGLGVALRWTRFAALGIAVWLAATVTAEVGVVGFVGVG